MADKQSQWRDFINKMESGMSDVSQNANSTINDGSSTDTQKSDSAKDYAKQQMFLTLIKEMYANGDYNNPTNTFGVNGVSSIYLSAKDAKYHACAMQPWSDAGEIAVGAELTHDILTSDEFVVTSHMENTSSWALTCTSEEECTTSGQYQRVGCLFRARPYAYWHCWFTATGDYFTPLADAAEIITGDNLGYYMVLVAKTNTWLNQNPLVAESFAGNRFWTGDGITLETCFATIIDIESEEMENPWDYYNDNILPTILDPDNKALPDGYEPPGPGSDPDDDPEEDEAPDKQDWGDPMNPNNGFGIPYAFANYIAFNEAGLRNFAERLWDAPDDFWEALSITNKNSANWLDYFISLRAYPYWVNSTGELANIYVGAGGKFYLGDVGTDVYASAAQHITYFTLNFEVPKYYNNFLDFAPYTKAQIYLPFSGTWEVNPKFLYHSRICISLKLDITDGSGVWQVYRFPTTEETGAGALYIILEKQCKIGVEIPLSGLNATTMASNIVNASLGTHQRTLSNVPKIAGAISGTGAGVAGAAAGAALGPAGTVAGAAAGLVFSGLQNSVDLANANREIPVVSGGMTGLAAANCNVIPSITLIRPVVENPESFPHTIGNLVNKASKLDKLDGYTTCRNVDVSNVGQATDKEKAQLKQILEGGFYAVSG